MRKLDAAGLCYTTWRSKGDGGDKLREMVIIRISALLRPDYEAEQHMPKAPAAGRTEEELKEITGAGRLSDPKYKKENAVLAYADDVFYNHKATDENFNAARAFLTQEQMGDLTALVPFYILTGAMLLNFEAPLDEGGMFFWDKVMYLQEK